MVAVSTPVVPTREVVPFEPVTVVKANVLRNLKRSNYKVAFEVGQLKYQEAVTPVNVGILISTYASLWGCG